jgi:hypothetical protein
MPTVIEGHADRGGIAYAVAVVPRYLAQHQNFIASQMTRGGLNFFAFSAYGAAVSTSRRPADCLLCFAAIAPLPE